MRPSDEEIERAYQLAHLLVGDSEGAAKALLEALRSEASDRFWPDLVRGALRQGEALPPDRFFLRSLSEPAGLVRRVNALPLEERTALPLDLSGLLTQEQISDLMRLPKDAFEQRIARAQQRLGGPPDPALWEALCSSLPPMEAALEARLHAASIGAAEPIDAAATELPDRKRGARRPLMIALALLSLLAFLFALRSRSSPDLLPRMPPAEPLVLHVTVPEPEPLDLAQFPVKAVIGMTTYTGSHPLLPGVVSSAEKVFQWLSEAEVVGEASLAAPGESYRSISFRFADGRNLWLDLPLGCAQLDEQCPVTVGGEGAIPLQVKQIDLSRWMSATAWRIELVPDSLALMPAELGSVIAPSRRAEIDARLEALLEPGLLVAELLPMQQLHVERQPDGKWRTALTPAWHATFRSRDVAKRDGALVYLAEPSLELIRHYKVTFPGS